MLNEIQNVKAYIYKMHRDVEEEEQAYILDKAARLKYLTVPAVQKHLTALDSRPRSTSDRKITACSDDDNYHNIDHKQRQYGK